MARFRKKPVVIEAFCWEPGVCFPAPAFDRLHGQARIVEHANGEALQIATLEGDHLALPGDYIIRGVAGEFYPCKPDIFAATYEPFEFLLPGPVREAPTGDV